MTAQDQGTASTLHVSSQLVVLDVVVLDGHGKPVVGLDKAQFAVLEDKVPQTIRTFDPPSEHAMPQAGPSTALVSSSTDLGKIGNAPVNIIVLDELNASFNNLAYANDMLLKYFSAQPAILPVPTLLLAAGATRFSVIHDYTQRRDDLIRALRKHTPEYSWKIITGAGAGTGDAAERLSQTLGSLVQIANSSRGTPGRKNVIWVGQGYPSVDMTQASTTDHEKLEEGMRTVVAKLLEARMTLNTVDPSGVDSPQTAAIDDPEDSEPLGMVDEKLDFTVLAAATGGQKFAGRNDVDVAIRQAIGSGGLYYTLSYSPTNKSGDSIALRKIRVAMKDPSLRAVTRTGYYGGASAIAPVPYAGEKPDRQYLFDMVSAATTKLTYSGLHVNVRPSKDGYILDIPAKDLRLVAREDGSEAAEITVVGVCFGAKDQVIGQHGMELTERVVSPNGADAGLKVSFPFPFSRLPGTTRVRLVVRSANTEVLGSANLP